MTEDYTNGLVMSESPVNSSSDAGNWRQVGYFGSYLLYGQNNLRRIVEPDTGKIIAQYRVNQFSEDKQDASL
jgi:hypothetical protein